jgi:Iron-containing redox enzyme
MTIKAMLGMQYLGTGQDASVANLCGRLIHVEDDFDAGLAAARAHIAQCDSNFGEARLGWESAFLESGDGHAGALLSHLAGLSHDTQSAAPGAPMGADERRFVLTQYAPQALLSGCVLQNLANASNCHEPIALFAHTLHRWHVGTGVHAGNHAALYRQLLESVEVNLPDVSSGRFSDSAQLLPASWRLTAYRLSLSLFPQECQAEILGAAWFELMLGAPALVAQTLAVGDRASAKYRDALQCPDRDRALDAAKAAIAHAIGLARIERAAALRVLKGFMVSLALHSAWSSEVSGLIHAGHLAPVQAMVRLVRDKAKYAVGYHGRLKFADQAFDDLIVQDPEQFVHHLGQSRWVSPGRPEASLLLTRLIAFGGPMFRVFSEAEVAVIRHWISALAQTQDQMTAQPTAMLAIAPPHVVTAHTPSKPTMHAAARGERYATRELYYRLLNVDIYPSVRSDALGYATTWLARSANDSLRGEHARPFDHYTHHNLRAWFEAKALGQAQSYCANADAMDKTRDDVIDEALQLCPMILIDGAWLQRWGNAGLVDSPIGALFYKIFSDEIGNGQAQLNHPNIYRDLMRQMAVDLPELRSREFAYFDRFTHAAFSVPVFWLSVSQFPRRFLPETLGLNLAMELSGVGGAYRTARDELRHYGFSTLFVDLHNTIDNVSSGHSAMAVDAIELYMDTVLHMGSPCLVDAHWRRVWTGFQALSTPKRSWTEWFTRPRYAA